MGKKRIISEDGRHAYGIKGLCHILNCAPTKAQEIARSGVIDDATAQIDKIIIFDIEKVFECLNKGRRNK